jgi:Photoprotection regulator fluorescence recovery protein
MDARQVETGNEGIENGWSLHEQATAHLCFDLAYERETAGLMQLVRSSANSITTIDDVWHLHDFLSARRHNLDGKYDFRYPFLIMVFAQLVKEGWLQLQELEGLNPDKRAKIAALSKM